VTKTLVVVESPAKAKTIEKYLGSGYTVRASYGHILDLPKSKLGVDVERDFEPEYVVPESSEKAVRELRSVRKQTDEVVLATDYDREGEAIAYHVAELLKLDPEDAKRVTFTEITKDAILDAFRHPRAIDLRLVDAQQARRILDRLVGYRLSPVLWKKVRPGLSAGRVQSVAVRLIVEREREIGGFSPVEYWSIDVRLSPDGEERSFLARLAELPEGKVAASPDKKGIVLGREDDVRPHAERLERASYRVTSVERKQRKRSPAPPFTTSTLQQEAARKLGFGTRKTMSIAQRLYEGVDLPGEGTVGLITYIRTDSVNIAETALREIAELVKSDYGDAYTLKSPRRYKTRSRNAQEAHEAIRPTSVMRTPQRVASALHRDQLRLYTMIWQRTVATQMADARFDQIVVDIEARSDEALYRLRAGGQTLAFDGFRRVYFEGRDDSADEDAESMLPELRAEQALRKLAVPPEQHFTQPPPRFTEASLVKALEELGIGRPSTYASIISTIQDRGYVKLEEKRFVPEDVAGVVVDKLVDHFPEVVDVNFTARLEEDLDEVAEGNLTGVQVLEEFNGPFERALEKAEYEFERFEEQLDELCPKCPEEGREPGHLLVKLGRFGKFVGCEKFPDCDYVRDLNGEARPEPELLDEKCPECGHSLQRRVGRYGPFVGCSTFPECKYIKKEEKRTGVACPECKQGEMVERRSRYGKTFYACDRYPECRLAVSNPPLKDAPCPECGSVLLARPKSVRCWNCGCELDLDMSIKKQGDPEAEAAARAAKAEARTARAAARKPKAKPRPKTKAGAATAKSEAALEPGVPPEPEPEPGSLAPVEPELPT